MNSAPNINHGKMPISNISALMRLNATAAAKAKGLALPAGLLVAALFVAMAALNALVLGVVLALATLIGPLAAGIAGSLIFAAIAGGLAWWAIERGRRAL